MNFTEKWKKQTSNSFNKFGQWLQKRANQEIPLFLYGGLCSLSLWPLVEAATSGQPLLVGGALVSVAGGVGGNLVAEQIQRWADKNKTEETTPEIIETWVREQVPTDDNLKQALDTILEELEAISQAKNSLPENQQTWFQQKLQQELQQINASPTLSAILSGKGVITQNSTQIASEGSVVGSYAGGDIKTGTQP